MKICFLGAGSSVFAKNILGDCILTPSLEDFHISLHDINEKRLDESYRLVSMLNKNLNGRATITEHLDRREALEGADFIVNAIQVGGYKPCTVTDFRVPAKYGLKQTIGDTLGIGGIMRGLRTFPVLRDFADDIEAVCPDALFLNYTNPMAMLTGYLLKYTKVKTVGLCHSVQACVPTSSIPRYGRQARRRKVGYLRNKSSGVARLRPRQGRQGSVSRSQGALFERRRPLERQSEAGDHEDLRLLRDGVFGT